MVTEIKDGIRCGREEYCDAKWDKGWDTGHSRQVGLRTKVAPH